MKTKSKLERVLERGQFAVTGEVGPHQSADPGHLVLSVKRKV